MWVSLEFVPAELPGFVLDWKRDGDGWQALVMYVDADEKIITTWMGSDRLRPVESSPQIGSAYG